MLTNRICCLIHIPQGVFMPSEMSNHKAFMKSNHTAQKHYVKEQRDIVRIQK